MMIDTWGQASLLNYLRGLLIHNHIPFNAVDSDVFSMIEAYKAGNSKNDNDFSISVIRFLGPYEGDGSYIATRLTIAYTADRTITEVYIG